MHSAQIQAERAEIEKYVAETRAYYARYRGQIEWDAASRAVCEVQVPRIVAQQQRQQTEGLAQSQRIAECMRALDARATEIESGVRRNADRRAAIERERALRIARFQRAEQALLPSEPESASDASSSSSSSATTLALASVSDSGVPLDAALSDDQAAAATHEWTTLEAALSAALDRLRATHTVPLVAPTSSAPAANAGIPTIAISGTAAAGADASASSMPGLSASAHPAAIAAPAWSDADRAALSDACALIEAAARRTLEPNAFAALPPMPPMPSPSHASTAQSSADADADKGSSSTSGSADSAGNSGASGQIQVQSKSLKSDGDQVKDDEGEDEDEDEEDEDDEDDEWSVAEAIAFFHDAQSLRVIVTRGRTTDVGCVFSTSAGTVTLLF